MNKEELYDLATRDLTFNPLFIHNLCQYQYFYKEELGDGTVRFTYSKTPILEPSLIEEAKIKKALEYIDENVYENDNGCGSYWWEINEPDKLKAILRGKDE